MRLELNQSDHANYRKAFETSLWGAAPFEIDFAVHALIGSPEALLAGAAWVDESSGSDFTRWTALGCTARGVVVVVVSRDLEGWNREHPSLMADLDVKPRVEHASVVRWEDVSGLRATNVAIHAANGVPDAAVSLSLHLGESGTVQIPDPRSSHDREAIAALVEQLRTYGEPAEG